MFPQTQPIVFNHLNVQDYLEHFEREGYVVIDGFNLCNTRVKNLFLQDLQQINPDLIGLVDEENFWEMEEGLDYPASKMQGLLGEYGLSQGDAAWEVRVNNDIQAVFRQVLGGELVCSTDAIGFSTNHEKPTHRQWLHRDQNLSLVYGELKSVQAIYYAEDVPDDPTGEYATTVVVPGTHNKIYESYSLSHFCIVDNDEPVQNAIRLKMKAGQLLVFSSRLIHQGWHGKHRLCFMVSYGLKSDRTEEARQRKILMYLCGHRSTHWSQIGQLHGYKYLTNEWGVVTPRLREGMQRLMIFNDDLYRIGLDWYEPLLDSYVPEDRLQLL